MDLNDVFGEIPAVDLSKTTCHSGGASGSDTYWEEIGEEYGVTTRAYSYQTPKHNSKNKIEISEEDYLEGVDAVNQANYRLNRWGIHKYMNLLARNWSQVKYSNQIFAIGSIVNPNKKGPRGYYNKSKFQIVEGGTGYAVQMGIDNDKTVYVFNQVDDTWYEWSYAVEKFVKIDDPYITNHDFAGIGTRNINDSGIEAIKRVYKKTLEKYGELKTD